MLAYINEAAWLKTLETGEAHYWSRSRQELWHKGGTSGHVQKIKEIYSDCDDDTVLYVVEQVGGAACHTGYASCFHKKVSPGGDVTLVGEKLFEHRWRAARDIEAIRNLILLSTRKRDTNA